MEQKRKELLTKITEDLIKLMGEKAKSYSDSWKSREGIGAFMNISRKWDRLENRCQKHNFNIFKALETDEKGIEGVKNSIIDLMGCCLFVLEYQEENKREKKNEITPVG